MAGSHGTWLSEATVLFFCWALLSLLVRVWVKLTRRDKWGLDDSSIFAGFAVCIFHIGCIFWAISDGYGRPLNSPQLRINAASKALYASQFSYIVAIGLTRVSTAFFVGRLTRYGPQVRLAYILAAVAGVWTVASMFTIAFRGNIAKPWDTLDGSNAMYVRWMAIEIIGLVIEISLFLLAINLIWGLKMSLQKRVLVLSAFGCRLLLIPLIITRIYYLAPSRNPTPTLSTIIPSIITEAALEYAFMSSSVTSLKPFLRPFHSGRVFVNTIGAPGSGLRTDIKDSQDPYYQLSAVSVGGGGSRNLQVGKGKASAKVSQTTSFNDDGPRAPLPSSTTTKISAGGRPKRSGSQRRLAPGAGHARSRSDVRREDGERESVNTDGSDQMIIRETKGWSVRYEDADGEREGEQGGGNTTAWHDSGVTCAI